MRTGNNETIIDDKQETGSKQKESNKSETYFVDLEKEYEEYLVVKNSLTSKVDNQQEFEHITRSNHNRTIGDQAISEQPSTTENLQVIDQEPNLKRPVERGHHQDDREQQEQEGKPSHHYFTIIGSTFFTFLTSDFSNGVNM